MTAYEFAIKKEVLVSGKEILIPVGRKKSFMRTASDWTRIVKIYDDYIMTDIHLDKYPELSHADCVEHIKAYEYKLNRVDDNTVTRVAFHKIDGEEIK